jgi:hypothetical protein
MSVDLIAAALILAFAAVVVLGHVLVIAAIYKCLREDHAGGAANVGETIEPQHARAFGARWLSRSTRPRQSRGTGLRTAAEQM